LVKSINKHTPGANIYIFDNSDIRPFINSFENVTVFDNTKGQIIDFDTWLKKYPNRTKSGGKANKWGSAKHAYSVEKCMELIGEPFVLLDSDVLIKNDFSSLFDDTVCYKGEVINQPGTNNRVKRVLPFICFINTPKCKEKHIHYFDENYMHGLAVGLTGDRYDTGGALYLLTEKVKAPHREIKVADYIVHYGNGSWVEAAEKIRKPKHIPAGDWLKKYKEFWSNESEVKFDTLGFEEVFDHIYCLHNLPSIERVPKLDKELKRIGIDETADYFSWVYDYPSGLLDLVYNDMRLNMCTAIKSSSRDFIKRATMKHYEIIKEAYEIGYERILIMEDDIRFHRDVDYINKLLANMPDTDIVMFDKMVSSRPGDAIKYKQYIKTLPSGSLYGDIHDSGVFFIFASCYALNRRAMKRIIDLQESGLLPSDTPLNDKELTGSFAVTNLAIQDPKFNTSDNESYTKIGLDISAYFDQEQKQVSWPVQVKRKTTHQTKIAVLTNKSRPISTEERTIVTAQAPVKKYQKAFVQPNKFVPDKAVRRRTITGTSTGYNKLYDVL
jgi:GR25 family glycosyltransferase involved in LPS biosynthesis